MTDTEDEVELKPAEENPWYVFMTKTLELDEADKKDRGYHWFWGLYYLRNEFLNFPKFDLKAIHDKLPNDHWLKKEQRLLPDYSNDFKNLVNNFKGYYPNPDGLIKIAFVERDFTTSINFSNFIFPTEVVIRKSVFSDDSDFSNTIFVEDVYFNDTKFSKNANFKNTAFYGDVAGFNRVNFEKVANFTDAKLQSSAYFKTTKFLNNANFKNATFLQDAYFTDAIFSETADFEKATFSGETAKFTDVNFEKIALFRGAEFKGFANFIKAKFHYYANFENVEVGSYAYFEDTEFFSDANFRNTTFSANAGFKNATFSSDTRFEKTTFSANATFEDTTFSNDVNFSDASFLKNAYFTDAVFSENVDFEKAKFCGKTAKFRNTVFEKIANFTNTTFEGHANFKSSKLKGRTNFQRAEFKFHAPRFYGAEFNNEMTFFGIIPPKFIYAPDEIFDAEDTDDTKKEKIILYEQRIQENQNSYENTAILLEEKKKYHDQHLFFRAEMRCRQKIERKRLIRWAFWVYERLANYGYGVDRAIKAWVCHIMLGVGVIMLMVLLSLLWEDWKGSWDFGKSLLCAFPVSFSNANPLAFIGFGDDGLTYCYSKLKSLTPFGFGMIRTVQIIVGIPLLFLLLVTLRVRFRIK